MPCSGGFIGCSRCYCWSDDWFFKHCLRDLSLELLSLALAVVAGNEKYRQVAVVAICRSLRWLLRKVKPSQWNPLIVKRRVFLCQKS